MDQREPPRVPMNGSARARRLNRQLEQRSSAPGAQEDAQSIRWVGARSTRGVSRNRPRAAASELQPTACRLGRVSNGVVKGNTDES